MIGRLDAPGAKLEPVMPGLVNRRSPSVAPPAAPDFLVRHHRHRGELIGDDRQHALLGRSGSATGTGVAAAVGAGRATWVCAFGMANVAAKIGLGAVTVISGSCVEGFAASWAVAPLPIAHSNSQLAPPRWNAHLVVNVIVLS